MLTSKIHPYDRVRIIPDTFHDGMMWIPSRFVGNEYFKWWITIILVLACFILIDLVTKYRNKIIQNVHNYIGHKKRDKEMPRSGNYLWTLMSNIKYRILDTI